MFGSLGVPEILFILVLALLVFGPKRLPELGRTIGRAMGEFRRASTDLRRTLNNELALEDEAPRRPRPAASPESKPKIEPSAPRPAPAAESTPRESPAVDRSGAAETGAGSPEAAEGAEGAEPAAEPKPEPPSDPVEPR